MLRLWLRLKMLLLKKRYVVVSYKKQTDITKALVIIFKYSGKPINRSNLEDITSKSVRAFYKHREVFIVWDIKYPKFVDLYYRYSLEDGDLVVHRVSNINIKYNLKELR